MSGDPGEYRTARISLSQITQDPELASLRARIGELVYDGPIHDVVTEPPRLSSCKSSPSMMDWLKEILNFEKEVLEIKYRRHCMELNTAYREQRRVRLQIIDSATEYFEKEADWEVFFRDQPGRKMSAFVAQTATDTESCPEGSQADSLRGALESLLHVVKMKGARRASDYSFA